jgi:hypothetical protein
MTVQINLNRLQLLLDDKIHLATSSHDSPQSQMSYMSPEERSEWNLKMCVMEAAAWIANEPWSDHPKCVDGSINHLSIYLNDSFPYELDAARHESLKMVPAHAVNTLTTTAGRREMARVMFHRTISLVQDYTKNDENIAAFDQKYLLWEHLFALANDSFFDDLTYASQAKAVFVRFDDEFPFRVYQSRSFRGVRGAIDSMVSRLEAVNREFYRSPLDEDYYHSLVTELVRSWGWIITGGTEFNLEVANKLRDLIVELCAIARQHPYVAQEPEPEPELVGVSTGGHTDYDEDSPW